MFQKLLFERMVRAFIASAMATFSVGVASAEWSSNSLRALCVGAGAAGISAVMSMLSQLVGDPESTSFTKTTVER